MGFIDRISRNNAKERMISEKLKAYKFSDRVKGKPLNIVSGNFTVPLENRIMAYAGIPEYIQRAKRVDEKIIKITIIAPTMTIGSLLVRERSREPF